MNFVWDDESNSCKVELPTGINALTKTLTLLAYRSRGAWVFAIDCRNALLINPSKPFETKEAAKSAAELAAHRIVNIIKENLPNE